MDPICLSSTSRRCSFSDLPIVPAARISSLELMRTYSCTIYIPASNWSHSVIGQKVRPCTQMYVCMYRKCSSGSQDRILRRNMNSVYGWRLEQRSALMYCRALNGKGMVCVCVRPLSDALLFFHTPTAYELPLAPIEMQRSELYCNKCWRNVCATQLFLYVCITVKPPDLTLSLMEDQLICEPREDWWARCTVKELMPWVSALIQPRRCLSISHLT